MAVGAGFNETGTTYNVLHAVQDQTTYRGIGLGYDSSSQTGVFTGSSAGAASNIAFWTYNNGYAEKMRITGAGNVGIGTASPDSNYRLTVAGGGVKAENSSAQPAGYFSSAGGGRAIQTGTGSILFANLAGAGSRMVIADASGVLSTQSVPSGINGGGADNYIPRWSGTSALENSVIYQTDTGNIGIGTTSPSTLLNTYSASVTNSLKVEGRASGSNAVSELWLAFDTGANAKEFRIQAVGGSHGTQANKLTFYDQTAGAYRMVIDNSGNVGIGTTGPDNKFEVMGADSRSIRFDVNTNVDALRTVQLIFDNAENDATDALSVISSRLTNGSAGNATTDLAFEVSKLGTKSEAMRINSSGNVGIGTTGPGAPLDVNATDGKHIRLQEGITDYGEIGYGYNVGNKSSTWIGTNLNSTSLSRAQSNTANSSWYALFNSNADVFTVNRIAPAGSDSTFLTINSSGNVGIGTASPDSNYRLTVAGGGVKAENSSAQPAGYFSSAGGGRAIQTGTGSILFANLAGAGSRMVIADASGVLSTQSVPSGINGGGADNYIPRWSGTSALENSVIYQTDTGNIGIGTTSPSYPLTVDTADVQNRGVEIRNDVWAALKFTSDWTDAGNRNWMIATDYTGVGRLEFRRSTAANGDPWTAGSTVMTFDNTGNVGIGTASPDSGHKLTVAGGSMRSQGAYFEGNVNIGYTGTSFALTVNGQNVCQANGTNCLAQSTNADTVDYVHASQIVYGDNNAKSIHGNPDSVFALGSGFIDVWDGGGTYPPGTSHVQGFQTRHSNLGNQWGIQLAGQYNQGGTIYTRGVNAGAWSPWYRIYTDGYRPYADSAGTLAAAGSSSFSTDNSGFHVINAEGSGSNVRLR